MTDGQTRVIVLLLIILGMEALRTPAIKDFWTTNVTSKLGGKKA